MPTLQLSFTIVWLPVYAKVVAAFSESESFAVFDNESDVFQRSIEQIEFLSSQPAVLFNVLCDPDFIALRMQDIFKEAYARWQQ